MLYYLLGPGLKRTAECSGTMLGVAAMIKFCEEEGIDAPRIIQILKLVKGDGVTIDVARNPAKPEVWTLISGLGAFEVKLSIITRDIPKVPVCGCCGRSDGWTLGSAVCTWPHLTVVENLGKLTPDQVVRMRDLYASGPLTRRPCDDALIASGWVVPYEGQEATSVEPSWAAYGKTDHNDPREARTVLYLSRGGGVNPFWLQAST